MAEGDEMIEGSVSSLIIEILESSWRGDVLSHEDLTWVDSCLIEDLENSDSNWNALEDALMEIVYLQPEGISYSSSIIDGFSEGADIEMHNPGEDAETAHLKKNDDDVVPIHVESETNDDSHSINKKTSIPLTKLFEVDDIVEAFVRDPFLPSYMEGKRVSEATDLGLDLDLLAVEIQPLSEDIFKVWDLNVPDEEDELVTQALAEPDSSIVPGEEDELVTQLNEALAESSLTIDVSGTRKDLKDESLDNLIAGIADLSLDPLSS